MENTPDKYSIIIPVYRSSESIATLASDITMMFDNLKLDYEIIFVNDSPFWKPSTDALKLVNEKYKNRVTVLEMIKNHGQHYATLVGMSVATGSYIITMDDDLQHPVSEIPKLISAMKEEPVVDALFAIPPYSEKKHNIFRNWGSGLINLIGVWFLEQPKGLVKSSFRLINTDICKLVLEGYSGFPALSNHILNHTNRVKNVIVTHNERRYGKSNYTLLKVIKLTLNMIVNYSSFPLAMLGLIGFGSFIFSLLFIAFILFNLFSRIMVVPGYTSTIVLISLFGGLNLLGIGIIGEYLIRIIKDINKPKIGLLYKINTFNE